MSPPRDVRATDASAPEQGLAIRLVGLPEVRAYGPRIVTVGSEKTYDLAVRLAGGEPARVVKMSHLSQAQGWLTCHHVDALLVDREVMSQASAEWLEGFLSSPLASATLLGVLDERASHGGLQAIEGLRALRCSYEDEGVLRVLLTCAMGSRAAAGGSFFLSGVLPRGGIRAILPILEAERRSGRLAIESSEGNAGQISIWIREGEPIVCFADGIRHEAPMGCVDQVVGGWFCFVETSFDLDLLASLDARDSQEAFRGARSAQPKASRDMRERLRVALATARTIQELREAVQSLLDLGIDKAAEEGDTSLMDGLADVSILLQNNQIDEAFRLLKAISK